jgi:NAD-dependent dihydropyrimidine dehydrogenase PreA subunit
MILCETLTGQIQVNPDRCQGCQAKVCVPACQEGILTLAGGIPVLAKPADIVRRGLCRECLACELECADGGAGGLMLLLPIEGLDS